MNRKRVFCSDGVVAILFACTVYGPENVTSGASSDIRKATNTASAMVRVSGHRSAQRLIHVSSLISSRCSIGVSRTRLARCFTMRQTRASALKRGKRSSLKFKGACDLFELVCKSTCLMSRLYICITRIGCSRRARTALGSC
jgi:hypothetical protein